MLLVVRVPVGETINNRRLCADFDGGINPHKQLLRLLFYDVILATPSTRFIPKEKGRMRRKCASRRALNFFSMMTLCSFDRQPSVVDHITNLTVRCSDR